MDSNGSALGQAAPRSARISPGHVNDPLVSGIWRPLDPDNFFVDDPMANIVSIGSWHNEVAGVQELVALRSSGQVPSDAMLTASWNILPTVIMSPGGVETIEEDVFIPIAALRSEGAIVVTDFTSLVDTWLMQGGTSFLHQPVSN